MRRSNARGLALVVAVGLSLCATLAALGWANGASPVASPDRGLPAGVSPLAVQARVSASDDPLLVRVPTTRGPRWTGALGLGAVLLVAVAALLARCESGRRWRHGSVTSAPSRAPPVPAMTLS